jgi:ABC-type uncharacterized transport system substrate-binding protein
MRGLVLALCCIVLLASASPLAAHPHVFVTVHAEVQYDAGGQLTGVRHRWLFDEMYSASAILGLDKNGDGKYDREELQELAKINVESLKEFDYFTFVQIEQTPVAFADPTDYYVEADDMGLLTLHFTLPAKLPLKHGSLKVDLSIYDPSFFIAFALAEQEPVTLAANAPPGCKVAVRKPDQAQAATQLSEDMFSGDASVDFGASYADGVEILCQ